MHDTLGSPHFLQQTCHNTPKVGTNFVSKNERSNRRCKPKIGAYYTVAITPSSPQHDLLSFQVPGPWLPPRFSCFTWFTFPLHIPLRLKILWFNQRRNFEMAAFLAQNAHQLNEHLVFLWLNEGEGRQVALNGNGRV